MAVSESAMMCSSSTTNILRVIIRLVHLGVLKPGMWGCVGVRRCDPAELQQVHPHRLELQFAVPLPPASPRIVWASSMAHLMERRTHEVIRGVFLYLPSRMTFT